ncbi:hypothetical protein Tco_1319823 [Tanacetum coccineum]
MVVKRDILYDFLRFLGVLLKEFSASGAVNFTLKMERDMIIENLDLEPKIDAMMRDFLDPSRWKRIEQGNKWKALDFVALDQILVSFSIDEKPKTAMLRWSKAQTRAAKAKVVTDAARDEPAKWDDRLLLRLKIKLRTWLLE